MNLRHILAGVAGLAVVAASGPVAARGVASRSAVHRARPGHAADRRDRLARTRCVGVDHVAGAVVFGDRAVEMAMTDGTRWRMTFDNACPALSFYQGFYYRRALAGRLCAGRDAVISRAGGSCPIGAISRVR